MRSRVRFMPTASREREKFENKLGCFVTFSSSSPLIERGDFSQEKFYFYFFYFSIFVRYYTERDISAMALSITTLPIMIHSILNIMILCIMLLCVMILCIMICSIMMLIILILQITIHSVMILSMKILSIMILSMKILSIMVLRNNYAQHNDTRAPHSGLLHKY